MNLRKLTNDGRSAVCLAFAWIALLTSPCAADIVETLDQGNLGGVAALKPGDTALTVTNEGGDIQSVDLIDIDRVRFNVDIMVQQVDQILLIDNDKGTGTRQKQAKIKLKAGLHRITLPYWQSEGNHNLAVYVAGPGINGRTELGSSLLRCFRDTDDQAEASLGLDDKGYRLPEFELKVASDRRRMLTRSRYRLYTSEDEEALLMSVGGLAGLQLKRSGTTSAINTGMLNEHNKSVGMVFDAFFKADQDGEYTFSLASDDGSQLYFGQVDSFSSSALNEPPVNTPFRAELAHHGEALGQLKSISDEQLTLHLPLVSDASIALSHVKALWDNKVNGDTINRDNEPDNEDTVYLRDKNKPEEIRSVSGKISSLDEETLSFVFRGQERSITRDRVVGLVFKHASRPDPASPGTYQVVEVQGGQKLPARIKSISDNVSFDLIGGGTLTPPRDVVRTMRVENGRRIDLTRVSPSAEEAIPYFGLKLSHKLNTNFSGKPIVLYNEQKYERGLAVHSKSRLHYKLNPNCESFQATFGLMMPGGKLGDVTARVLGDGKVIWEQDNITAATGAVDVDVPLKGVERLILEVDFGGGQNVGDRAAWCNPRLIYSGDDQP
jgi:hypothetical protein